MLSESTQKHYQNIKKTLTQEFLFVLNGLQSEFVKIKISNSGIIIFHHSQGLEQFHYLKFKPLLIPISIFKLVYK